MRSSLCAHFMKRRLSRRPNRRKPRALRFGKFFSRGTVAVDRAGAVDIDFVMTCKPGFGQTAGYHGQKQKRRQNVAALDSAHGAHCKTLAIKSQTLWRQPRHEFVVAIARRSCISARRSSRSPSKREFWLQLRYEPADRARDGANAPPRANLPTVLGQTSDESPSKISVFKTDPSREDESSVD